MGNGADGHLSSFFPTFSLWGGLHSWGAREDGCFLHLRHFPKESDSGSGQGGIEVVRQEQK